MPIPLRTSENLLLASLQGVTLERLLPHLSLVELTAGETVFTSGTLQTHVYFPVTATISLCYLAGDDVANEISLVGKEGMIGIPLFLKGSISPCSAVVNQSGRAFRMSAPMLTAEFNRAGPALRVILAYARELSAQMEETAQCTVDGSGNSQSCSPCGHAAVCPHGA